MNRKLLWLLTVFLLACSHLADAQQPIKVPTIGWLSPSDSTSASLNLFLQEFRNHGYIDGKNIVFEPRYANSQPDRLLALAEELARLKVDVIIVSGSAGTVAAKKATSTIPVVFLSVPDPVALGLVESMARPGGNITGFSTIADVLAGKRLELLKDIAPRLSRIAVLWNPESPSSRQQWNEAQRWARKLGLQLHSMELS